MLCKKANKSIDCEPNEPANLLFENAKNKLAIATQCCANCVDLLFILVSKCIKFMRVM